MAAPLQINDPISVTTTDSSSPSSPLQGSLQGIVAHLGPVQFSPDDDWVGVRLTGSSIGRGRNDGSVGGVRYFDAGGGGAGGGAAAGGAISVTTTDSSSSSGDTPLHGIVAHLGPVQFSPDDDWVGVRLTGTSVGKGRNDGSVGGVKYFDAGGGGAGGGAAAGGAPAGAGAGAGGSTKNGLFVKRNAVKKRELSKLEELRLKRELRAAGVATGTGGGTGTGGSGGGSAPAARKSPKRSPRPSASTGAAASAARSSLASPPPGKASASSTSGESAAAGGGGGTTRSRLEEIRAKRAALQASKEARTAAAATRGGGGSPRGSPRGGSPRATGGAAAGVSGEDIAAARSAAANAVASTSSSSPVKAPSPTRQSSLAKAAASSTPTPTRPSSGEAADQAIAAVSSGPDEATLLAEEVTNLKSQLSTLQTSYSTLQSQTRQRETEHAKLESTLGSKVDEVDELRVLVERSEGRAKDANERASELQGELVRVRGELEGAKQQSSGGDGGDGTTTADASTTATANEEAARQLRLLEVQLEHSHAAIESAATRSDNLEREVADLQKSRDELEARLAESINQIDELNDAVDAEKRGRQEDAAAVEAELTESRSAVTQMKRELEKSATIASNRGQSEQSHLKERARLEAELGTLRRTVKRLEGEREESESALEELALDKDALAEEKDALQDQVEEMKIDMESAQVELEECRMELEEARVKIDEMEVASATGGSATDPATSSAERSAEDDETSRTLAIQNSRLRDALIKLRDQSNAEKLELNKELRSVQKQADRVVAMTKDVEEAKAAKATLEEEVNDLKEMVDQNSAFESMVEELSDRVMALEDDVVGLSQTVREMEEAAELAAEMEEVQTEELKATMMDLEGKDSVIRNLEEAIRMQRRREEDFQRTVSNYRSSVEKLQQEKTALLALQEGGEGERSTLIAKSQRALAKAATLVADAAKTRKREADAAFDRVDAQFGHHLSDRLESYLPHSAAVSSELSAAKGELLLAKVASKASMSLAGVATVLSQGIQAGVEATSDMKDDDAEYGPLEITDEATQQIANVLHETKFARLAIQTASESIRILSAGQWPDLLTTEGSSQIGSAVLRSIPPVDSAVSEQLRILKEEGVLSSHRSNLVPLESTVGDAITTLASTADVDTGDVLIPPDWSPPGWSVLQDASKARFDCLGAAAAVAAAVASSEDGTITSMDSCRKLSSLLSKLDQICTETSQACTVLTGLPADGGQIIAEAKDASTEWRNTSSALFDTIKALLFSPEEVNKETMKDAQSKAEDSLRAVVKLSSTLRSAKVVGKEGKKAHSLSPEAEDPWTGVASVVRKVRVIDGDEEDINYIIRANSVEKKLSEAIDSESKLEVAKNKVTRLEKSLVSRSKEISIQNTRLSELEQLLSASGVDASVKSPAKKGKGSASDEIRSLQDENRMLTEAMDVLHGQVDEYEREIRSLKDSKPGKSRGAGSKKTPKKAGSSDFDLQSSLSKLGQAASADTTGGSVSSLAKTVALEAALFRPALSSARSDASAWKAKAIESSLMNLPPLNVPKHTVADTGRFSEELALASTEARLAKASFRVVDLTKKTGATSRIQLREELARTSDPIQRLEEAASAARQMISKLATSSDAFADYSSLGKRSIESSECLGRVKIPGPNTRTVPLSVHKNELDALHHHMLQ